MGLIRPVLNSPLKRITSRYAKSIAGRIGRMPMRPTVG